MNCLRFVCGLVRVNLCLLSRAPGSKLFQWRETSPHSIRLWMDFASQISAFEKKEERNIPDMVLKSVTITSQIRIGGPLTIPAQP